MPDDMVPCTPIPCPSFTEVNLSDVVPIEWTGIDFPVFEPADDFNEMSHLEQVANVMQAIEMCVADMRYRYRFTENSLVIVKLPEDSTIQPVLDEVRTRGMRGVLFEDPSGY